MKAKCVPSYSQLDMRNFFDAARTISKVLALRIQNFIYTVIHREIEKNRYVGESVRLIDNVFPYADENEISCITIYHKSLHINLCK